MPEHRIIVLESLGEILRRSPNVRLFMTGRRYVWGEVERRFGGAVSFILIQPTEDGVVRYIRERLRNDTAPEIMSATLEADIMRSIPEISSEMYVGTSAKGGLPRVNG